MAMFRWTVKIQFESRRKFHFINLRGRMIWSLKCMSFKFKIAVNNNSCKQFSNKILICWQCFKLFFCKRNTKIQTSFFRSNTGRWKVQKSYNIQCQSSKSRGTPFGSHWAEMQSYRIKRIPNKIIIIASVDDAADVA